MSIVIYSKGVLGADRRCIINGAQWNVFQAPGKKVHMHESKTFAIAFAGHIPGPRSLKLIFDTIHDMLLAFHIEGVDDNLTLTDEIKSRLFSESRSSIIAMTKSDVWLFSEKQTAWIEITHLDYFNGNGAPCAAMCLGAGLSVDKALQEIPAISGECGDGYDIVKVSELKAMKVVKANA